MRVQSIILLLISSQEVSYSLSSNKTLPNKKCGISSSDSLDCNNPGIHCNKDLGVCECDSQYPIPLGKIGFCLDYRKPEEECLTEEQCSQENSFCFGGKQIESITENDVRNYFNGRDIPGKCRCKIDYLLISNKCLSITNKNFKCSRSDECTKTVSYLKCLKHNTNVCLSDRSITPTAIGCTTDAIAIADITTTPMKTSADLCRRKSAAFVPMIPIVLILMSTPSADNPSVTAKLNSVLICWANGRTHVNPFPMGREANDGF